MPNLKSTTYKQRSSLELTAKVFDLTKTLFFRTTGNLLLLSLLRVRISAIIMPQAKCAIAKNSSLCKKSNIAATSGAVTVKLSCRGLVFSRLSQRRKPPTEAANKKFVSLVARAFIMIFPFTYFTNQGVDGTQIFRINNPSN